VYGELDQEIADANASVGPGNDRIGLLNSRSFANYGSLLQRRLACFPAIRFVSEGLVEWSPEEILTGSRNVVVTGRAWVWQKLHSVETILR